MAGQSKEMEIAIKIAGEVQKSFTNAISGAKSSLDGLSKAASGISSGISGATKDIDTAFSPLKGAAETVFAEIVSAAEVAGAGIAAALGFSVNVGMGFEQAMSEVKSKAQASDTEMDALTEKAKELGATTQFTAQQVANAMYYMATAGWDTSEIEAGIGGLISLTASSGEDLATVSDIVTDAMSAFGMGADEVQEFADLLAQTAANSNTDVGLMGETFKYAATTAGALKFTAEDAALAIGLMANSGIKGTQAGTALRNIMTNMANPTDTMQTAMDNLGVSLVDSEGRAKSFYDIMLDLREGFSDLVTPTDEQFAAMQALEDQYEEGSLTDEEFTAQQTALYESIYGVEGALKAQNAAMLAGKFGMAGLLAIVNASDEDFNALKEDIDGSQGAAEEMANTRLDNLAGDITLFKSALDGLGIEIYDQISDPMRDAVSAASSLVSSITTDLGDSNMIQTFMDGLQERLPTIIGGVKDFGEKMGNLAKPVLELGGWLVDHPGVIAGLISGIGSALVANGVLTNIPNFVGWIQSLGAVLTNPWAGAILLVTAAIGGLVGLFVGEKVQRANDAAKDMADHFGNIQLSLKDMESAAEDIVNNGNLDKLSETINAFEATEGDISAMESAVSTLNKSNWKVSMGLELTEAEQSDYQSQIDAWSTACQQYVTDQGYAVHLALSLMTEGTDTTTEEGQLVETGAAALEAFYTEKQEELAGLGKELNEAVTNAFNDGLLEIDEVEKIQQIQSQMASIQEQLASSEYEASLNLVGARYSGANLTAESFKSMQVEIQDAVDAATEKYDQAYTSTMASLAVGLQNEAITQEQYDAMAAAAQKTRLDEISELNLRAQQFTMNTLMDTYGADLGDAIPGLTEAIDAAMAEITSGEYDFTSFEHVGEILTDAFYDIDLTTAQQDAIQQILDGIAPQEEELRERAAAYEAIGEAVPEEISAGLSNITLLKALNGDIDAIYALMDTQLTESGVYDTMEGNVDYQGRQIPQTMADALEANKYAVQPAVDGVYQTTSEYINSVFANGFDVDTTIRVHAQSTTDIGTATGYADGGIVTSPELAWVAEGGYPESVIPWDGSQNALGLWMQTGEGIGAFDLIGDAMDSLDGGSDDGGMEIVYSPTINFYGGTPSKDDIVEAGRISQREFNQMMAQYERDRRRVSFGRA